MNIGKYLSIGFSVILISGCSSTEELKMGYDAQIAVAATQSQMKTQDTFVIKCTSGCDISYLDPRDRNKVAIPRVTNTNDVLIGTMPSIIKGFTWAVGLWAATDIFSSITDNAGDKNYSSNSINTMSGENNIMDRKNISNNQLDLQFESQAEVMPE